MTSQKPITASSARYMFAGLQSFGANLFNLKEAKEMMAAGRSVETIRTSTGWHMAVDGVWRFEISDDQARLTLERDPADWHYASELDRSAQLLFGVPYGRLPMFNEEGDHNQRNAVLKAVETEQESFTRLGNILRHPTLYAAYPALRHRKVQWSDDLDGSTAAFSPSTNTYSFLTGRSPDQLLSSILHEVQHDIQEMEGFASGGNTDQEFILSIKSALSRMAEDDQNAIALWMLDNKPLIEGADQSALLARSALMYDSMLRLQGYASHERPSSVLRHIRNELQWLYDKDFYKNPKASEVTRGFYDLPKRHRMHDRNEHLRQMAIKGAAVLEAFIPEELLAKFKNDERTLKSMVNAFRRESARAREKMRPLSDLQRRASTTGNLAAIVKNELYPHRIYERLAGEIEARNTQARQKLSAAERRNTPPWQTADRPDEEAIVIFGGRELKAPVTMRQIVHHGGPHRFDTFDVGAVGTGQGAQSFGWGLYFAGAKEVAEYYRATLSRIPAIRRAFAGEKINDSNIYSFIAEDLSRNDGDTLATAVAVARLHWDGDEPSFTEDLKTAERVLREHPKLFKGNEGYLYSVEIPEDQEYLDWDKPLSEQSETVKNRLGLNDPADSFFAWYESETSGLSEDYKWSKLVDQQKRSQIARFERITGETVPRSLGILRPDRTTGEEFYNSIALGENITADDAYRGASEYLHSLGIPGIRYLDQHSRSRIEGQTYNYVIFDHSCINPTPSISKTRYLRSERDVSPSISRGAIKKAISRLVRQLGVPAITVSSTSELPEHLITQEGFELGATGIFDGTTNQVYVVAENITSLSMAVKAYIHEVRGHLGLRAATGGALDEVLAQVYQSMPLDAKRCISQEYADQLKALSPEERPLLVADEYIADLASTQPDHPWYKKLLSLFLRALRKVFPIIPWSERDIHLLLDKGCKRLAAKYPCGTRDEVRFMRPEAQENNKARAGLLGTYVVNDEGDPLLVYRGEHGESDQPGSHSRLGSITFGTCEVANKYALEPNHADDLLIAPRIVPAYLAICRPLVNDPTDPFIDFSQLAEKLGNGSARNIAIKHSEAIQSTALWCDEYEGLYENVSQLLAERPEALQDFYCLLHKLLDDEVVISELEAHGFDGAIYAEHGIYSSVEFAAEYRVFNNSQIYFALQSANSESALVRNRISNLDQRAETSVAMS